MMACLILLTFVRADVIVENVLAVNDCIGAPAIIYHFEMANLTSVSPNDNNETWPPNFEAYNWVMPV
jgi:hypothetical protein